MPARPRFGAFPLGDGRVEFRVWAPNAASVALHLVPGTVPGTCLAPIGGGVHEGVLEARPGDDYFYVLDGDRIFPDPSSGDVPYPQDPETFARSKLSREERPGLRELYAELLRLRRELPHGVTAHGDDAARIVKIRRGEVELVADFGNRTVDIRR